LLFSEPFGRDKIMAMLTVRSYQGEIDLQPIAALCELCWKADPNQNCYTVVELKQEFNAPGVDPTQDVRLWEAAGQVIGFGHLHLRDSEVGTTGFLGFRVHPEQQRGLEQDILAWAERRMRQIGQAKNTAVKLMAGCQETQLDRITLLENCGFAQERCFLTMSRSLTDPLPDPQLPAGFRVVDARMQLDETASIELYNQTFIDHWSFHPLTIERLRYYLNDPDYRPELDLVAISPDGTYSAFCFCSIYPSENERQGCAVGWVNSLGARRGFRRMGLGRALLLMGLHRLQKAGMAVAKLGVDANNPHHAQLLYESVGFQKVTARLSYSKPIT
jgi:ribosomal protein S18 acetylase RimI-like enzyme